jgi:hypothetical protein
MVALYVFLALFLALLALLAFGAFRVFSTRDDKGRATPVGCVGGLAALALIVVLGSLGLGVLWLGATVASVAEIVEHNPVERVGVWVDPASEVARDAELPLHVLIEASEGFELPAGLVRDIERDFGGRARITVSHVDAEGGERMVRIDVALPVSERDVGELMDELLRVVGGSQADGVEVRMKGVRTDW